ncbi:MAG: hypothetical protein MI725_13165, partial [Pirellulales bacterium]|nr:hypothetical protein [Pirellulales bacterium]
ALTTKTTKFGGGEAEELEAEALARQLISEQPTNSRAWSLLGYALAMPGIRLYGATLDAHTLLASSLAGLLGFQLLQFAVFAKTFAIGEGLIPEDSRLGNFLKTMNLERCLLCGLVTFLAGTGLLVGAVSQWQAVRFGALDYATTMRWVIPGVTLAALGFQTIFSSFFVSILRMRRKK